MKLWDQAVGYWEINDVAIKWMWSILARTPYRIDMAVTTKPAPFAQAVTRLVERNNWPIRYVFAMSAAYLGVQLPTMPDVDRVFYGLPEQRWAYGPNGVFFSGAGQVV